MPLSKLLKRLKRIEKKYETAGPVEKRRLMRMYTNTQAKMRKAGLLKEQDDEVQTTS